MRRTRQAIAAMTCCAGLTAGAAASTQAAAAAPGACTPAHTQVWLGNGEGGGFAGGVEVPLEFSNISGRPCTLFGYPGVSAFRGAGRQAGPAAGRIGQAHGVVILAARQTAHAWLKIVDSGAACPGHARRADGLKVFLPGQRSAQTITTPLSVCPHTRVLFVGPTGGGVGIPGFP